MADILELSYSSSQICVASIAASSLNEHSRVLLPAGQPIRPKRRLPDYLARTASRNEEDLLRVGILDLAPRLVARHIDITAVGVVRTENVPRFPGNRLRYWELCCAI
jgi:hypothetical protein